MGRLSRHPKNSHPLKRHLPHPTREKDPYPTTYPHTIIMKHITTLLVLATMLLSPTIQAADAPSIVPRPQQMKLTDGAAFKLNAQTKIRYQGDQQQVAELLASALRPATGFPLPVLKDTQKDNNRILLMTDPHLKVTGTEGYTLVANSSEIEIRAKTTRGLFNATQTLIQLLPTKIHSKTKSSNTQWSIPAVAIQDHPAFPWRGMMLDVSRYFFTKEYVLRYLDMMAMHKMNALHWHLIDDAGWRIEIKKYPRLTEIGGFRGKGENRYGGFYTQEDIKEIVAYATARNITIVPEIELPAHTLPALVAYPHLGCFNKKFEVPTRHSISPELYCAGKETTWTFLEDVFTEVAALFPGTYIHIGGDEARFSRWNKCPDCQARMKKEGLKNGHELQGWMTTRVEKFLKTKGKRIIGWDEILGAGVSKEAGIMTWHKPRTAVDGAKRGNPVVMSLTGHAYFDVAESKLPGEPPTATWIKPISLEKAYRWDPIPAGLTGAAANNILGASGCIWTDQFLHKAHILADKPGQGTTASEAYVDYLSLPRMGALSEVCWTAKTSRNYENFTGRMRTMLARYTELDYQYRIPVPDVTVKPNAEKTFTLSATPAIVGGTIRYTVDGSTPTTDSKVLNGSVNVAKVAAFRATTFAPGDKRHSLLFQYSDPSNKYGKQGTLIGKWKSGQVGNTKAKEVIFDATGHINSNGLYTITFLFTGGRQRLDIDGIEVVRNDTVPVGKDIHHGFTGSGRKNNTYKIKVSNYETGASFKIKAMIYGDEGADSNGVVLIRKGK